MIHRHRHSCAHGFSLVELSIVLVILGLLVGGVLSGQSLIRAAQLRTVSTQYNEWRSAMNTFRDKYFALPGDMTNATSFWSTTVNGDGDGYLPSCKGGANPMPESFHFWEQLALAGLIEGSYPGTSVVSGNICNGLSVPGTNVPASKINPGAGWTIVALNQQSNGEVDYTDLPSAQYNWFIYGLASSGNGFTSGLFLKPEDVWNIDTKMDDGLPGTGIVRAGNSSASGAAGCQSTALSATSVYNLSVTTLSCDIVFPIK